jgi:mono/diheme cytochrome c family protein
MAPVMRHAEATSRILVGALVLAAAVAPLWLRSHTPLLHAQMAETGGWAPDTLRAKVNEPLHLRLTSDDVAHGFAVGQMEMQSVDVMPGKVSDVTLVFREPGTYTFYCTRWCGINHWRMRGTIEVSGTETDPAISAPPLYVKLGLDLDAPHEALAFPGSPPSAPSAQPIRANFAAARFLNRDFYREHSPFETWQQLRANSALLSRDDQQIWNLVAFIWQSNTTVESMAEGKKLYAQNCAACHGETGGGNGVFADQLAAKGAGGGLNMMVQRPANLADLKRMLGASPALLEGKILRGGMGTGMPSWGPILTERQSWNLVAFLYSFQFPYQPQGDIR